MWCWCCFSVCTFFFFFWKKGSVLVKLNEIKEGIYILCERKNNFVQKWDSYVQMQRRNVKQFEFQHLPHEFFFDQILSLYYIKNRESWL